MKTKSETHQKPYKQMQQQAENSHCSAKVLGPEKP